MEFRWLCKCSAWLGQVCGARVGGDYVKLCSVASRNSGFCSLQFCSGMRDPFDGKFGLVIVRR